MPETEIFHTYPGKGKIDVPQAIKDRLLKGMSYSDIASKNDCSYSAVRQRLQPIEEILASKQEITNFRENEVNLLDSAKMRIIVEALSPDKLKKSSTLQLTTAYSQLFDKTRLLQGKSLNNIDLHVEMTSRDKLGDEIANLMKLKAQAQDVVIEGKVEDDGPTSDLNIVE